MSHAPYHSAKILFYFGLPTFFGALFHRSRARKERGEFSLFHSHSTGALSILERRRKNKPTIRKNTTTFRSFFSTFRQRFATFLHFRRRKVKIASLQRRPHARVTRTQRFFDFCLHPSPPPPQALHAQHFKCEGFTLFFLHLRWCFFARHCPKSVKAIRVKPSHLTIYNSNHYNNQVKR